MIDYDALPTRSVEGVVGETAKRSKVKKLTQEQIARMPVGERLRLMNAIWESFENDAGVPPVSPALAKELRRRLAEHRKNPSSALGWEDVCASLEHELASSRARRPPRRSTRR